MGEKFYCPKCGKLVIWGEKVSKGYFAACLSCDEDFYKFELIKKGDNMTKEELIEKLENDYGEYLSELSQEELELIDKQNVFTILTARQLKEKEKTKDTKTCKDCGANVKIVCCPDCGGESLQ